MKRYVAVACIALAPVVAQACNSGWVLFRLLPEQRDELFSKADEAIRKMQKSRQDRANQERQKRSLMSLNLVKELYKKGETALKEGDLSAAYSYFMTVAEADVKGAEQLREKSLEKLLELEAEALARYDEADVRFRQGDYVKSALLLNEIIELFPYTSVTDKARRMLRTLTAKPSAAAAVLYARGKQHEDAEDYARAVAIYEETVQKYPDELDSKRAKIRLDKLRSDPVVLEALQRASEFQAAAEAPKLLNLARNYILNSQHDRAVEQLQEAVKRFPGTKEANEAQELLSALKQ